MRIINPKKKQFINTPMRIAPSPRSRLALILAQVGDADAAVTVTVAAAPVTVGEAERDIVAQQDSQRGCECESSRRI